MLANDQLQGSSFRFDYVRTLFKKPTQEQIVFLVTLIVFISFAILLDNFLTVGNLLTLARNVSILGILGVGMGIVVISRGIDLSQVASMAVASAWVLKLMSSGLSISLAILFGLMLVILIGMINGFCIAFIEIPALFMTLASGIMVYGFVRTWMLSGTEVTYLPSTHQSFLLFAQTRLGAIPIPIIIFVIVAALGHLLLSRSRFGLFVYSHGDSEKAARLTGVPVRKLTIIEYVISALVAYIAGLLLASSVGAVDTRIVHSTLIFDVILVVVLGGITLIGGRGSIWSVVVGTILIGTLLNGMTIMNIQNDVQTIFKSLVLLGAIILDNRLHPRDEETARQGDI